MNIYLRYFDNEILVSTPDEAIDFLRSIDEIGMDDNLERDVRTYLTKIGRASVEKECSSRWSGYH